MKDPWMRLLTTTLGMCVVDVHQWYRNKKYEEQLREARGQSIGSELLAIRKFSDQLCVNLERKRMISKASARSVRNMPRHGHNVQEALERMARNGSVTRDPTEKQTSREHRSVGLGVASLSNLHSEMSSNYLLLLAKPFTTVIQPPSRLWNVHAGALQWLIILNLLQEQTMKSLLLSWTR
jgi:hypothetical protein